MDQLFIVENVGAQNVIIKNEINIIDLYMEPRKEKPRIRTSEQLKHENAF